MRRGDLVTVAIQGDFGKPRPALVIQADSFIDHPSVTVLPITSALIEAPMLRVTIEPGGTRGVRGTSQVMVDKAMTVRRDKVGPVFGRIDEDLLVEVERRLAIFIGIAK